MPSCATSWPLVLPSCPTQNPVRVTPSAGSTPASGTTFATGYAVGTVRASLAEPANCARTVLVRGKGASQGALLGRTKLTSMRTEASEWNPESAPVLAWIERSVGPGARVLRADALPASSTAKHLVEVALMDGTTLRLVLRRYHDADRVAHDPWYVPAHEALPV